MSDVIDCSVAVRALVPSQVEPAAEQRLRAGAGGFVPAFAPVFLELECANVLQGLLRRERLTADEADGVWSAFTLLPIEMSWERAWVERARVIAHEARLGKVYDAIYLACAEWYDLPLVTADASFVRSLPARLRERVTLIPTQV